CVLSDRVSVLFFFDALALTALYTLSLHDALPIWRQVVRVLVDPGVPFDLRIRVVPLDAGRLAGLAADAFGDIDQLGDRRQIALRSEEHTSELQSRENLVCRLLLEKKKKT